MGKPPLIKMKVLAALKEHPAGLTVRELAALIDYWEPSVGGAVHHLHKEHKIKANGIKTLPPRKNSSIQVRSHIWVLNNIGGS